MLNRTIHDVVPRTLVPLVAAMMVITAAGCGGASSDAGGAAAGLATLTAASAGAGAEGADAETPAAARDVVPVASESTAQPPAEGGAPEAATEEITSFKTEVKATRRAEDEARGIADVSDLVQQQPPLATFTPGTGSGPGSSMVYVRNGKFYTAAADGSRPRALAGDVPRVWAPPDDPGRAWSSPDGRYLAFFGGRDATLWVMEPDGTGARAVSGPSLPTGEHSVRFEGGTGTVRLHPGQDYTLVLTDAGKDDMVLFVDNNNRHVRGKGRLRIIHAAAAAIDEPLTVWVNGGALSRPLTYGGSTGDFTLNAGPVSIELQDSDGQRLALFTDLTLGDRELKTVFLYGSDEIRQIEAAYEPQEAVSGASRVKIFNATSSSATVSLDGTVTLVKGLTPGSLSAYASAPAVASRDVVAQLERVIYGLIGGGSPVVWSPDSRRIAFLAAPDGQADLYVADREGGTRRVTNDAAREVDPAWSPGGKAVAWISIDDAFGAQQLYAVAASGGSPVEMDLDAVRETAGLSPDRPVKLPAAPGWVDDDTLYFYPVSEGSLGIWTADAGTGATAQVFDGAVTDPAWSPEARSWAVVTAEGSEVVVVSADGGTTTVATGESNAPIWSPDGRLVSWVEGDSASTNGWVLHVVGADGTGDKRLTEGIPLLQESPPVPGPKAKRFWLDGGKRLAFTRAGRDYGAAEREGSFRGEAGMDIENLWIVPVDGSAPPARATDLTQAFYMKELRAPPSGDSVALVAFSYLDRTQKLYAFWKDSGSPVAIDSNVRWFTWLP